MLSFLTGDSYEALRRIASGNEEALEIVRDLEDLMMEEKYIGVYDRNKENVIMQNTLYKEGIEQGAKSNSVAIAKNMKEREYSIDEIILLTGLTKEETEKL